MKWKLVVSHLGVFALGCVLGYFTPNLNRSYELSKEMDQIQSQIKQEPNNADNWSSLGVLRLRASDKRGAEAAYQKAIELDSSNVTASIGMGNLQYESGDFGAAEKWYANALRAAQAHNNPFEISTAQQLLKSARARKTGYIK